MADLIQIGAQPLKPANAGATKLRSAIIWLQIVTLAWMLVEFGVSAFAAVTAHSPAMLAFGSDSLVELLSAAVVLLQWSPRLRISERGAHRTAGVLLFVLAGVVALIAAGSLVLRMQPETSLGGIGITVAALIAMPVLATLKRREARRTGNAALAADAVQSATCAYIAVITLAGLAMNAVFHIPWFDSLAALAAIPILVKEADRPGRAMLADAAERRILRAEEARGEGKAKVCYTVFALSDLVVSGDLPLFRQLAFYRYFPQAPTA